MKEHFLSLGSNAYLQIAAVTAISWIFYTVVLRIYRVYFHPLASFKGPRAAAVSRKWLRDQSCKSSPEAVFEDLHQQYATRALRIGPNELHLTDPSLYRIIYSQTNPLPKNPVFYNAFGTPHTSFAETDFGLHRIRRKLLNPLFSKSGISKLENLVLSKIRELGAKVESWDSNTSVSVDHAFRSMTTDIISSFAFDSCTNFIPEAQSPMFESDFLQAVDSAMDTASLMHFSPFAVWLREVIPQNLVAKISSAIKVLVEFEASVFESVKAYHSKAAGSEKERQYPVLFDYLQGLSPKEEAGEATNVLVAGTDTTAFTLTVALYHILRNPDIHQKLRKLLDKAIPDENDFPSLSELEQLEFLRAIVKESLRMAMPVPGRLQRVVPDDSQPLKIDGQVIPSGTVVGMSAYTMHRNCEIWGSNALEFVPDRWIGEESKGLDQYLVPFSKGTRSCIGMNLAYAELTMTLTYFFRVYDMKMETDEMAFKDRFASIFDHPVMVRFATRT